MSRAKKMYENGPTMGKDDKGRPEVKNKGGEGKKAEAGAKEGVKVEEANPPHIRHAQERRDMNNRHETEHSVHDHIHGGDKKEMHGRHEKERADMHKRHEKEITGGEPKGKETGEKAIKEPEKKAE